MQKQARAAEALEALPAQRELVAAQQELQVCGCLDGLAGRGHGLLLRQQKGNSLRRQALQSIHIHRPHLNSYPPIRLPQARISGLESDITMLRVDIKSSQDKAKSAQKDAEALTKVGGVGCVWGKSQTCCGWV